ncbi:MAG: sulfide:quinone oxidoreductase, partial [Pseudomonadota bacterium]|nr:sulfide:quinone oxidoreductase [Pseudomonadota bacterium]
MNHTTPHIVILGAGFAALKAARELRRQAPQASIRIVSPSLEFVYLPSLIWIPTGLRQGADLCLPLQPFLDKHRLQHTQASVTGLRDGGRIVQTEHGEIHNDALIIATGGRFIKQLPGIEHALTLCEGISAAETIGQRLRQMAGGRIAFGFGGNP